MLDERLSEFLDGECDADASQAAVAALLLNPERRRAWQRQLWLREALHGQASAPDFGFADRVAQALDNQTAGAGAADAGKLVSLHRRGKRRWRTAAGLATAASLAAGVLVVGGLRTGGPDAVDAGAITHFAAADSLPSAGAGAGASGAPLAVVSPVHAVARGDGASDHWAVSDPVVADQLNGYLIEHNGVARGYGLAGATPSFVRVATYGRSGGR